MSVKKNEKVVRKKESVQKKKAEIIFQLRTCETRASLNPSDLCHCVYRSHNAHTYKNTHTHTHIHTLT